MAVESPAREDAPPPSFAGAPAPPWPTPGEAWRTLWILSLVLGLSQIDRNILSLLLEPIKADLKLTDLQMGTLIGLAFAVLYLPLNFPMSLVSDRKNRKTIIAIGVTVWSLSTAACGLARSYWSMFWARAFLGAGECVNGPATYSLLGDSFPREKLPRAMGILNLGFMAGTALSLILGAGVIAAVIRAQVVLPGVGLIKGWNLVFFTIGLPGLVVAALTYSIKEPARRGVRREQARGLGSFFEVFPFLLRNGRFYGCMFASVLINGIILYGSQNFRAAFFGRSYHWSPQLYGAVYGSAQLAASLIGLYVGVWLCERWNQRHHDGNMRVALVAYGLAIPFNAGFTLMPNGWLAVACGAIGAGLALMAAPPVVAAFQSITPSNVRAQVNSLYLLMFSGITGVLGPIVIGWLTDLQHDKAKLGLVIAAVSAVGGPVAWVIQSFALKPFGRMIERLKAEEAASQV